MEQYEFTENQIKVAVTERLKHFNGTATDVWDYLEKEGFLFHGVIRDWSGVFYHGFYYVFHHFLNDDQPQEDCIPPDSGITWDKLFKRDTVAGKLFSFMESNKFRIFIPEQAAIDAFLDGDMDSSLQSPKHKFQIYCFQDRCSLLVELYLQQTIPPYGAHYEPIQYPEDRCQLFSI